MRVFAVGSACDAYHSDDPGTVTARDESGRRPDLAATAAVGHHDPAEMLAGAQPSLFAGIARANSAPLT
jgi:hypothetical protein